MSSLSFGDSSDIANLVTSSPSVNSLDNSTIDLLNRGQQVVLSLSLSNRVSEPANFIAIIEVRDKSGITTYLQFQKGSIAGHSEADIGISWTVDSISDHEIRGFLISDFKNPVILSPITETKLTPQGKDQLVVQRLATIGFEPPGASYEDQGDNDVPPSIDELKELALKTINEDREKYGLNPVSLSDNMAAQAHADDLFKTRYHSSHWTSDGMKPYMRYSVYGGEGAVFQNVHAGQIYPDEDLEGCQTGRYDCEKVDMAQQLKDSEYGMMYDDAYSHWGHRDNILDPYHTHVSIGIAYDDYYFAYVQNFENLPITFDEPLKENKGYVDMSGTIDSGAKVTWISVYYDELPTVDIYNELRDSESYDFGDFIAAIVRPARPGYYYEQPSNYTLVEARQWITDGHSFHIEFDLDQFMNKKNGVYTIAIWVQGEKDDYIGATKSFFEY